MYHSLWKWVWVKTGPQWKKLVSLDLTSGNSVMDENERLKLTVLALEGRVKDLESRVSVLSLTMQATPGLGHGHNKWELAPGGDAIFVQAGDNSLAALHQDNKAHKTLPKGSKAIKQLMEESIKAGWEEWDHNWDAEAAKVGTYRGDPLTFSIDGQLLAWVNLDGTIGGDPAALLRKSYSLPMKGNIATLVAAARLMVRALKADPTLHSTRYRPTGR